jgi:hypothetical protein
MTYGIAHEVREDPLDLQTICQYIRQPRGHLNPECTLLSLDVRLHRGQRRLYQGGSADGHEMGCRLARFDPGEIKQVTHQFLQPFTVFPTDRQHLTLRVCQRPHRAFQQEMDTHLHTGERCA